MNKVLFYSVVTVVLVGLLVVRARETLSVSHLYPSHPVYFRVEDVYRNDSARYHEPPYQKQLFEQARKAERKVRFETPEEEAS